MADKPRKKRKKEPRAKPDAAPPAATDAADEEAFVESLVVSGQASGRDADGKLPPGVTHELVVNDEGEVKALRRRFSAY